MQFNFSDMYDDKNTDYIKIWQLSKASQRGMYINH